MVRAVRLKLGELTNLGPQNMIKKFKQLHYLRAYKHWLMIGGIAYICWHVLIAENVSFCSREVINTGVVRGRSLEESVILLSRIDTESHKLMSQTSHQLSRLRRHQYKKG